MENFLLLFDSSLNLGSLMSMDGIFLLFCSLLFVAFLFRSFHALFLKGKEFNSMLIFQYIHQVYLLVLVIRSYALKFSNPNHYFVLNIFPRPWKCRYFCSNPSLEQVNNFLDIKSRLIPICIQFHTTLSFLGEFRLFPVFYKHFINQCYRLAYVSIVERKRWRLLLICKKKTKSHLNTADFLSHTAYDTHAK